MIINHHVGIIDLIPPDIARPYYDLDSYPHFIEFYLTGTFSGKSVMTDLLPMITADCFKQGIPAIAAAVNLQNASTVKVLSHAGFRYAKVFDPQQDLYICN